ncbi:unnamed protein product [Pieris macdunnoughi]|uniref:Uncharacterized protein n=1 Tax=Pieris macdunnoughi TaxID=345717 RepID=A0A821LR20_9NEOP|nr:unnamed protein product [Pieris macdunnoughi]
MSAIFADMPKLDNARSAAALAAPPGGHNLVLLTMDALVAPADPNRRLAPIIATADPAEKILILRIYYKSRVDFSRPTLVAACRLSNNHAV